MVNSEKWIGNKWIWYMSTSTFPDNFPVTPNCVPAEMVAHYGFYLSFHLLINTPIRWSTRFCFDSISTLKIDFSRFRYLVSAGNCDCSTIHWQGLLEYYENLIRSRVVVQNKFGNAGKTVWFVARKVPINNAHTMYLLPNCSYQDQRSENRVIGRDWLGHVRPWNWGRLAQNSPGELRDLLLLVSPANVYL